MGNCSAGVRRPFWAGMYPNLKVPLGQHRDFLFLKSVINPVCLPAVYAENMAGFPVYASRGKGGGIRLMERFILDRRLLTGEEQQRILAAMASLRETGAFQDEKG